MQNKLVKTDATLDEGIEYPEKNEKKVYESKNELLNLIAEIIVEIIIKKYRNGSNWVCKNK